MVMIVSQSTMSSTLSATEAPLEARSSTTDLFRSKAFKDTPSERRLEAIDAPMFPKPMKPTEWAERLLDRKRERGRDDLASMLKFCGCAWLVDFFVVDLS